jgi:hypothetical protein
MSAIAVLTLNDGAATPVAHTFSPVMIDSNGVAAYADRIGGVALGFPKVTFSVRPPTKTNRNYRVTAKIVTPVLEVTSPNTATGIQPGPTLAYQPLVNVEFVLPERSSLQQRKDLLAYARNFLAHAVVTSAVQDFETVY